MFTAMPCEGFRITWSISDNPRETSSLAPRSRLIVYFANDSFIVWMPFFSQISLIGTCSKRCSRKLPLSPLGRSIATGRIHPTGYRHRLAHAAQARCVHVRTHSLWPYAKSGNWNAHCFCWTTSRTSNCESAFMRA
jgi:hypothetical protein